MTGECQDVLAICRAVFATDLGPDDGLAQSGGHSLLIARLAQQLQAAGWTVAVRALLSDCNTARKVASRPRVLQRECKVAIPVPGSIRPQFGVPTMSFVLCDHLALLFLHQHLLAVDLVERRVLWTRRLLEGIWSSILLAKPENRVGQTA